MEKEQNQKTEDNTQIENKDDEVIDETSNNKLDNNLDTKKEETEIKPEDKIRELEDLKKREKKLMNMVVLILQKKL